MKILNRRTGGCGIGATTMTVCLLLTCTLSSTARGGQIVYPWRATTAIVKAGQTFEVWFKADLGQEVTAARLESPYKTLAADIKELSKTTWVYDKQSGETCNRKITLAVPAGAPADRYALVLDTTHGEEKSPGGVKEFKSEYRDPCQSIRFRHCRRASALCHEEGECIFRHRPCGDHPTV